MTPCGQVEANTRIIACEVFRPALEHLHLEGKYPSVRLTYLPCHLHMWPDKLRTDLFKEILSAQERNERIICLYGNCFPGIDDFCQQQGTVKVPGPHCYEMLLGSNQFARVIEETAGTYFLEKELILNFEEYCVEPLELNDKEMRKYCFANYRRLLYIRQPSDPDLVPKADECARFLELSLEIRDADYSHLDRELAELIRHGLSR